MALDSQSPLARLLPQTAGQRESSCFPVQKEHSSCCWRWRLPSSSSSPSRSSSLLHPPSPSSPSSTKPSATPSPSSNRNSHSKSPSHRVIATLATSSCFDSPPLSWTALHGPAVRSQRATAVPWFLFVRTLHSDLRRGRWMRIETFAQLRLSWHTKGWTMAPCWHRLFFQIEHRRALDAGRKVR